MKSNNIDNAVSQYRREKQAKRFLICDQIRDELAGVGVEITAGGWRWKRWRALAVASRITGEKYEGVRLTDEVL